MGSARPARAGCRLHSHRQDFTLRTGLLRVSRAECRRQPQLPVNGRCRRSESQGYAEFLNGHLGHALEVFGGISPSASPSPIGHDMTAACRHRRAAIGKTIAAAYRLRFLLRRSIVSSFMGWDYGKRMASAGVAALSRSAIPTATASPKSSFIVGGDHLCQLHRTRCQSSAFDMSTSIVHLNGVNPFHDTNRRRGSTRCLGVEVFGPRILGRPEGLLLKESDGDSGSGGNPRPVQGEVHRARATA